MPLGLSLAVVIMTHLMNMFIQLMDIVPDHYKKYFWFASGCIYILIVSVAAFFNPDGTSARVGYDAKRS